MSDLINSNNPLPPIKLLTIGDSISQGFMSMAAARTDLSYSSIIAREMGWISSHPAWNKGGHPLNLELVFRKLTKSIGSKLEVWNPIELGKSVDVIFDLLDDVEEYYERGEGRYDADYIQNGGSGNGKGQDYFHNIAVRGFNVSDAWTVSFDLSKKMISKDAGSNVDDKRSGPASSFFRTAARVLSRLPNTEPAFNTFTAIDWLKHHTNHNGGVENVFLWLGANNALATVLEMKISQTSGKLQELPRISTDLNDPNREVLYALYENYYNKFNLWHKDDFLRDYKLLLDYVDDALVNSPVETKVFVATVPYVTIAPIARGMGKEFEIGDKRFFEYYTYFPFDNENIKDVEGLPVLRLSEVLFIEETITEYNKTIKQLVADKNESLGKERYFIVDLASAFEQMAFRRNKGVPAYPLPDYVNSRYPKPDTRYYERHPTQGAKGGLFSLDGVHPTAIGHGILAYEFMNSMIAAGVPGIRTVQGRRVDQTGALVTADVPLINWERIYEDDLLYSYPLPLVNELFKHDKLKKFVIQWANFIKG